MKVPITNKIRTLITLSLVLVMIISILVANVQAKKQDKIFEEDFQKYRGALQLMSEQKLDDAERLLEEVTKKHKDEVDVLYNYGLLYAIKQDYQKAVEYFQKAQEERPALILNQTFLAQFGEILMRTGDTTKAKVYLTESQKLNQPGTPSYNENLANAVNQMLEIINNQK